MKKIIFAIACAAAVSISGSAIERPTMGWSSWNTYRVDISDSLICRQADAMLVLGLGLAGYTYINIDDGFFGGRDDAGQLKAHPSRFPSGLRPVVDHIHSLGFKAGIYSDAGRNTCGNFYDNDTIAHGVGLYGHDDNDARFFFDEMGFDFIKIDFCGGDAPQNSESLDLDERERYTAIRRAIDAVGREDVRINICRWGFPGTWVDSIGSSWRISHDINPSWESIKYIIAKNTPLSAYAGPGRYNDMDMLEIGRGLSAAEERTHFGMWCMMSSPLLIGCDMTAIPDESLRLITNPELIALNQDTLGLQAYPVVRDTAGVTLFVKDIESRGGLSRAVAIYNPSEMSHTFSFALDAIDLGGEARVRDLIARKALDPASDGKITVEVGPHDTRILRLDADERHERKVYEGETAWLRRFQDIGYLPQAGYAAYVDDNNAACSATGRAAWIGNHPDNTLEWRDVASEAGGEYTLTIDYIAPEQRTAFVSVNGQEPTELSFPAAESVGHQSIPVVLRKGLNNIMISNPGAWAPDIDRIVLERR